VKSVSKKQNDLTQSHCFPNEAKKSRREEAKTLRSYLPTFLSSYLLAFECKLVVKRKLRNEVTFTLP